MRSRIALTRVLITMFQVSSLLEKRSTLEHRTQDVVPHGRVSLRVSENGSTDGVTLGASVMASFAWILLLTDEGTLSAVAKPPGVRLEKSFSICREWYLL